MTQKPGTVDIVTTASKTAFHDHAETEMSRTVRNETEQYGEKIKTNSVPFRTPTVKAQ